MDKKMNSLTEIILLMASTLIAGQFLELEDRELPQDLTNWFNNKTDEELAYEDCMSSYTLCTTFQRTKTSTSTPFDNLRAENQICAVDKKTQKKGTFKSLCELHYENCKKEHGTWGYINDGPCVHEIGEYDEPTHPQEKQDSYEDLPTSGSNLTYKIVNN